MKANLSIVDQTPSEHLHKHPQVSHPRIDQEQPCLASKEIQQCWADSHGDS